MSSCEASSLPSSTAPAAVSRARRAVIGTFLLNGALVASWLPRIPAVKEALALDDRTLGLALLGPALGALVGMRIVGRVIERTGSRPLTRLALVGCAITLLPIAWAPGAFTLGAALFLFGACSGAVDVAMNAHAVLVEGRARRPLMSGFHASFSVGGLLGALLAAAASQRGLSLPLHFAATALLGAPVAVLVTRGLLPATEDRVVSRLPSAAIGAAPLSAAGVAETSWRRHLPVLLLGGIAFACLLGEGAAGDWSAVYLRDQAGASPAFAAAGYGAFSAAMITVRLLGDGLRARLGAVRLVRLGGLVAAAGLGGGLLLGGRLGGAAAFALLGLGLGNVIPCVFSAAGQLPGVAPGRGLSAVSLIGYFGLMVGPPLIGLLVGQVGLTGALLLPAGLAAVTALAAGGLRRRS